MYNKVILIGNLTKDVVLTQTGGGAVVAALTLAVNTKRGEQEETYFAEVQVWGKQAENASLYLAKGSKCLVEGRMKTESWEKNGEKKTRTRIIADNVRYLSSPKGKDAKGGEEWDDPF